MTTVIGLAEDGTLIFNTGLDDAGRFKINDKGLEDGTTIFITGAISSAKRKLLGVGW